MYKLIFILACLAFLPISFYIIQLITMKWLSGQKKKQEEFNRENARLQKIYNKDYVKKEYESNLKPYYQEAQQLFHHQMKAGKLTRERILYLRHMIEDELGSYVHDYDDYSKVLKNGKRIVGFENDCHRIYVYLKSWHIDEKGWKKIISFLKQTA